MMTSKVDPVPCVLKRIWADLYKAEMRRSVRYLMKCSGDFGTGDAADAACNAFVDDFRNSLLIYASSERGGTPDG